MTLIINSKPLREKVQQAWSHFLSNSYTNKDLSVILESLMDDDDFLEFYESSEREWNLTQYVALLETEADRDEYRRQATDLLSAYDRSRKNKNFKINRFFYMTVASIILLCLLIPSTYFLFRKKQQQMETAVSYIESTTGLGEVKTIFLPDNSKVTLNANSYISYPAKFADNDREIVLRGEALFDVAHDPERPFHVTTNEIKVMVFGTLFDVKAYDDDNLLLVSVASGKVGVVTSDMQMTLLPDEQIKWDKTTGKSEKLAVEADKYLSWTSGTLYFNRTPIREVVNMINRRYSTMEVILADGEYSNLISGEFDNKEWKAVVTSIIYSTRLQFKQENNRIFLFNDK